MCSRQGAVQIHVYLTFTFNGKIFEIKIAVVVVIVAVVAVVVVVKHRLHVSEYRK